MEKIKTLSKWKLSKGGAHNLSVAGSYYHKILIDFLFKKGVFNMQKVLFHHWLSVRFCIVSLSISVVVLPLAPVTAVAAEQRILSKPTENVEKNSVVKVDDTKKTAPMTSQGVTNAGDDGAVGKTENSTTKKTVKNQPVKQTEEGLSTLSKVGIGVGAAAVVGGALLLAGGSGDGGGGASGSASPVASKLVGQWNAQAKNDEYGLTFAGLFNLYEVGSYTYDYDVSNGMHEQGTGTWTLTNNRLTTVSDTGSTFVGEFQSGNSTMISMHHTILNWEMDLSKQ